jgi:DNA-binding MarR family transcriptional regulator
MTETPVASSKQAASLTALILAVFKLNGALIAAGDRLVADLRLTSARWQVLGAVAMATAPQTVADIARTMGLTRQSVQRIVNELIASALLERSENPRHMRAPLMQLTASGKKTYLGGRAPPALGRHLAHRHHHESSTLPRAYSAS